MNTSTPQELYSTDLALQLSGVAPNVIYELSGIYPTFVSAFKELVSNAYDADANLVTIHFSSDFSVITVEDDGIGMTPFELQTEYIRIGGSMQRKGEDMTRNGRRPIGRKGIGFIAVARYCHKVEVYSHTDREVVFCEDVLLQSQSSRKKTRRVSFFQESLAPAMAPFTTVQSLRCGSVELTSDEYKQDGLEVELSAEAWNKFYGQQLTVRYTVDTRQVDTQVVIDYDYLLSLKDDHNLETLQDFCRVHLAPHNASTGLRFTRVSLHLHEFVQRELQAPRRRGRVRNLASGSGLHRFLWHLSRNIPVSYNMSPQDLEQCGLKSLTKPISPTPFTVKIVDTNNEIRELKRPLLEVMNTDSQGQSILTKETICIESNGLVAHGYLMGFSQAIFPAELRGIAIRVRGVEIGHPNFLGIENDLPAKYRPFLSQMMGEIIVTKGLDAISAIMPGREGFYAENIQFQTLYRHLVGDGAAELGVLGQILDKVYEQYRVASSVARLIQETQQHRQAFLDVSQALTALSIGSHYGRPLQHLFTRSDIEANGLSHIPEYHTQLPSTVGSYKLEFSDLTEIDYELDIEQKIVQLNPGADMWDSSLYILGRDFTVSLRNGRQNDPLCEIDFSTDTIYLNWMHPTRNKMGDTMFVKSALFLRIAYLAASGDVDLMMGMTHHLLSFNV